MFGILRYTLSLMVVFFHVTTTYTQGWSGHYAVFSFYVLSGFLMAFVINEVYTTLDKGTFRFLANRLLRLFPLYWGVLLLSALFVSFVPLETCIPHPCMVLPTQTEDIANNVFLVGLSGNGKRLIYPAWSLDIELFYYVLMGLVLARSFAVTTAWFLCSLLLTLWLVTTNAPFFFRYLTILPASLPFSMGAMLYWVEKKWPSEQSLGYKSFHVILSATLYATNVLSAKWLWGDPHATPFYLSMGFSVYLLWSTFQLNKREVHPTLASIDEQLGRLSYAIFLAHWLMASLTAYLFSIKELGLWLFFLSLPLIHLSAFAFDTFIERPMEAIRRRVRGSSSSKPTSH